MYFTPGVYFEQLDRNRQIASTLQTDIAGFLGYTSRGPLFQPVKLTSWRQYQSVFGQPVPGAYLADSIYGFFENGGAACYVVRIANDPQTANLLVNSNPSEEPVPIFRLWASHGTVYDPITDGPLMNAGKPLHFDSPGAWGNGLAISVQPASLGRTQVREDADWRQKTLPVDGVYGFEKGSIVRIIQADVTAEKYFFVQQVDPIKREITLDKRLSECEFKQPLAEYPIRLESVEFNLRVFLNNLMVEEYRGLSLSSEHSNYIVQQIQAASQLIDVEVLLKDKNLLGPELSLPIVEQMALSGGTDGLSTIDQKSYLDGLECLQKVDEVSLVAAPDLVFHTPLIEIPDPDDSQNGPDCHDLTIPPNGKLEGRVISIDETGKRIYLEGVEIRVLGQDMAPKRSENGTFSFKDLPVGHVTLRLTKDGFRTLETTAQATQVGSVEIEFFLEPILTPKALEEGDIFDIQMAMIQQGEAGHYRMALLEPPRPDYSFEQIQNWRARFDSSYAALYYPWLEVSHDRVRRNRDRLVRPVPPSGYVAGVIARTDLETGVHRAPANQVVQGAKALTQGIDDAQQAVLNPMGINCIRVLPGRGIRIYGARTLSSDPEWRYVNVRRLMMAIEEAVEEASQWAVFEPNNVILRQTLTYALTSFLTTLWRSDALVGDTPDAAFRVQCDEDNNPPDVVDAGQLIAEISVAPTIPFEFITFRLGRTADATQITEL